MIDINLKGLVNTTHAAVPHLLAAAEDSARNCADLVNISSVAGRLARSGSGVYNLTKQGSAPSASPSARSSPRAGCARPSSSPAPSRPSSPTTSATG